MLMALTIDVVFCCKISPTQKNETTVNTIFSSESSQGKTFVDSFLVSGKILKLLPVVARHKQNITKVS